MHKREAYGTKINVLLMGDFPRPITRQHTEWGQESIIQGGEEHTGRGQELSRRGRCKIFFLEV